jgi:hypothetical protein
MRIVRVKCVLSVRRCEWQGTGYGDDGGLADHCSFCDSQKIGRLQ